MWVLGMQLQLKMIDHFEKFDKKNMPNAFNPANKLCRYDSIIAYSQANLNTQNFPGFRHYINGSAHAISCQSA